MLILCACVCVLRILLFVVYESYTSSHFQEREKQNVFDMALCPYFSNLNSLSTYTCTFLKISVGHM